MNQSDFKIFKQIMDDTAAALCTQPISPSGIKLIFDCLAPYTLAEVKRAISAHLVSDRGHFMPKAADIVRQIEGSAEERGAVAWRFFLNAVFRYGYYASVRFPNPAFHYVIDKMGGWEYVSEYYGNMTERELDYRRPEFLRLYAAGEKYASWVPGWGKVAVPAYMPGFYERDNHLRGYDNAIPDPINVQTGHKVSRAALMPPKERPFAEHNEYLEAIKRLTERTDRE